MFPPSIRAVIFRHKGGGVRATGGTITIVGGYVYHTFTTSGTFVPSSEITGASFTLVGGGQSGSAGGNAAIDTGGDGGNGGAGGWIISKTSQTFAVQSYTVTIAAGDDLTGTYLGSHNCSDAGATSASGGAGGNYNDLPTGGSMSDIGVDGNRHGQSGYGGGRGHWDLTHERQAGASGADGAAGGWGGISDENGTDGDPGSSNEGAGGGGGGGGGAPTGTGGNGGSGSSGLVIIKYAA